MEKSPGAFRTISEVADAIDLPQHVLRFWETRFPQIRPLKRAGGRRYYRPEDVDRLRLIKRLLYDEGYTIKGVQKLFKEQGVQALTGGAVEPRLAFSSPEPSAEQSGEEPQAGAVRRPDPVAPAAPEIEPASELRAGAAMSREIAALRGALADLVEAARILDSARASEG